MDINTTKKLNNGVEIPYLGFGTLRSKNNEETVNSVRWAIEAATGISIRPRATGTSKALDKEFVPAESIARKCS